ncbi:thiolase C-terminal domain-containing protein [Kribbella solani]|uniref:Acetyl-CoA acetyltransferase n=1 Tax=Kribbella solani TaxID=236067 RepID=A0A841DQ99_9ACTN|nr:hypothetical protein [Kribbella solani]MBB5980029.1 acetyl-CoA acetyltransferase [Kribbella solani]
MTGAAFRAATAIAGIGWTAFGRDSGRTTTALATEASLRAIDDAGLTSADIDGVVTYCYGWAPDTMWPEELVAALGLSRCDYQLFDNLGGAAACSAVLSAAMAVYAGLCENVLVYRAMNGRSERPALLPPPDQARGKRQWGVPFGALHAAANLGPAVTAYMQRYGITNRDFAGLAVLQREHAVLNTKAMMRDPLTVAEHQESPWIVEPFRRMDCCLTSDGAAALVVTSSERARDLRHGGVSILAGLGGAVPATDHRTHAAAAAPALYRAAGITVDELDFAQLYDAFTGTCLQHVEDFGLCEVGAAPAWIADGQAGLDGATPLNTHGGLLSEAYLQGLGHVVEAVQQLRTQGVRDDLCAGAHDHDRGRCRQVRDAEVGLVCGQGGDSSLVLRKAFG